MLSENTADLVENTYPDMIGMLQSASKNDFNFLMHAPGLIVNDSLVHVIFKYKYANIIMHNT